MTITASVGRSGTAVTAQHKLISQVSKPRIMVLPAISDFEPLRCPICDYAVRITETDRPDEPAGTESTGELQCPRCQSMLRLDASGELMIRMSQSSAQRIATELAEWRTSDGRPTLLLDFSDVQFLGSEFLNQLVLLQQSQLCGTVLCNLSPEIEEVFAITKLNRVFDIRTQKIE